MTQKNAENSGDTASESKVPESLRDFCFKPGQSGNPGGRPKRKWLTDVTEELLEEKLSDPQYRADYKEQLWQKLLSGRVVGAMTLDRVWERTEGKIPQSLELNGEITITLSERIEKARAKLNDISK